MDRYQEAFAVMEACREMTLQMFRETELYRTKRAVFDKLAITPECAVDTEGLCLGSKRFRCFTNRTLYLAYHTLHHAHRPLVLAAEQALNTLTETSTGEQAHAVLSDVLSVKELQAAANTLHAALKCVLDSIP